MARSGKTITFATDLLPNEDNIYNLGIDGLKWKIRGDITSDKVTTFKLATPLINGSRTAQVETSPYQGTLWKFNASLPVSSLATGDTIIIKTPGAGGSYGVFLSLDNGNTYRPISMSGASRLTTHFSSGVMLILTYNASGSVNTMRGKVDANGILDTTTGDNTVSGGRWEIMNLYDSGNSNDSAGYIRYWGSETLIKTTAATYAYQLMFSKGDGQSYIPANTTKKSTATNKSTITTASFNIFDNIFYHSYDEDISSGSSIRFDRVWLMYRIDLRYSFNIGSTLTAGKDVYLVVSSLDGIMATLRNPGATEGDAAATATGAKAGPITQTLPSSDDGYLYIKLGTAYNTYCIILTYKHPIYWYKNDALRLYSGASEYSLAAPLSGISDADDLKAIEALSGTSGLLKKTAANTWTLDTTGYTTNTGTVTSVQVQASSPLQSSSSSASSTTLNTTISFKNLNKNLVLASDASTDNKTPAFRSLVAADLPTVPVSKGGTGATSFTANSLIMSGNTTTAALTTRAITDRTSVSSLTNIDTWAASTNIPTVNLIANWDGRYLKTNNLSNLIYLNKRINFPTITGGTGVTASDLGASADPRYRPASWKFNAGITPIDGDVITVKKPSALNDYGTWLSLDNGTTWYPIVYANTSRLPDWFSNNYSITLRFDAVGTCSVFGSIDTTNHTIAATNARSTITGVWRLWTMYDSGAPYGVRVYRLTTGYNGDYPLLVSRTLASSIGTAGSNGSNTNNVYAVIWNDTTKIPTLNPSTGEIKAVKFTGIFNGDVTGNADTATKVKITSTSLPSTGSKISYLTFSSSTTTGNLDLNNADRLYIYENTTAIYLNVGKDKVFGGLSLHSSTNTAALGNLVPTVITANTTRTWTLPDATGWVVIGASAGVGDTDTPVYLKNDGTLATITSYDGNAATATTLETSRKIWGRDFNGSADVTGDLDWDSQTYRQRIKVSDNSTTNDDVFTFSQSTDSGSNYTTLLSIQDDGCVWAGSYTKNTALTYEHDLGVRGGAGKIYFWSAAAVNGSRGIYLTNANESTSSTLFTVNQSNLISAMATVACKINVAYANTASNASSPMIQLTDSAAATVAKSGVWMWGLDHVVSNLAQGGHTCLITGAANATNKAAVLEFNYNNASTLTANTVGLGLYGNNGLLTIDGNGQVSITKATDATSTTNGVLKVAGGISVAKAIYMGGLLTIDNSSAGAICMTRTSGPNWIWANNASTSIAFCVDNALTATSASLKIEKDAVTGYNDNYTNLGTNSILWKSVHSYKYIVEEYVTMQWNATDQSLDFVFA